MSKFQAATYVAVAASLVFNTSALALGKYTCEFRNAGSKVHQCTVDSTSADQAKWTCSYKISSDVNGLCFAIPVFGEIDALGCLFTSSSANTTDVLRSTLMSFLPAPYRVASPSPGFVAGGYTAREDGKGNATGVYTEKQGAPQFDGYCSG